MPAQDAFDILADPANRVVNGTTIREGLWATETFAALSKSTGIPVEEYEKAAKDPEAIGLPKEADGNVEGWLFPSTYEFAEKSTATQQLKAMVAQTVKVLDEAGVAAKDAGGAHPGIARRRGRGQARRRPRRRSPASSSTGSRPTAPRPTACSRWTPRCHYGAKRRALFPTQGRAGRRRQPLQHPHPPGLPPGPISNPGEASIEAAANPADGPWYFFVTVDPSTGETKFADDPGGARRATCPSSTPSARRTQDAVLRAAVLGSPIAHSLSPVLHRAGYAAAGLAGWEYDAHEVDAAGLAGVRRRAG